MMKIKGMLAGAALSVCTLGGAASADLIGVELQKPFVVYNSTGVANYNAQTDLFSVSATLLAMQVEGVSLFLPIGSSTIEMDFKVDHRGRAYAGVSGNDMEMKGSLDIDGDGIAEYSGLLLSGEIQRFGHQEAGATDEFDAVFRVTGGAMAGLYGKHIALTITSENSTFNGNFCYSFGGGAKGTIGNKDGDECPRTPHGWKQACRDWPSDKLTLGGVEYNARQLFNILNDRLPGGAPSGDNITVDLARYLIAAKFSILDGAGVDLDVIEAIAMADTFLAAHPIGSVLTDDEEDLAIAIGEELEMFVKDTSDCGDKKDCKPRHGKKKKDCGKRWRGHCGWGGGHHGGGSNCR